MLDLLSDTFDSTFDEILELEFSVDDTADCVETDMPVSLDVLDDKDDDEGDDDDDIEGGAEDVEGADEDDDNCGNEVTLFDSIETYIFSEASISHSPYWLFKDSSVTFFSTAVSLTISKSSFAFFFIRSL